jgi:2-C-methyl-D-erythritol 4-phosphate cytidylyltransferase
VVVAAPPAGVAGVRTLLADHDVGAEVEVVAGGATRQQSVRLRWRPARRRWTSCWSRRARPLVPVDLVDAVVTAVRRGADAVVPALPVADTIKVVDAGGTRRRDPGPGAPARGCRHPQGYRRALLEHAHLVAGDLDATDDAGLVERSGATVVAVAGAEEAFKVTRPIDLVLAEALLARRRAQQAR